MALRVALGNNKGGTGKTTVTVQLAAGLAEHGKSVLVIDMDPQANASRRLGFRYSATEPVPTISEAIRADAEGVAADAITETGWPEPYTGQIDLIPARFDLENRISEAAVLGAGSRLRKALAGVDDRYDFTLIDCPPSLGHLTQLALAAAHHAICVLEPEYDAVEGAIRFRDFIDDQAAEMKNPDLAVIGYVVNRLRSQLGAHDFQLEGLPDLFGDRIWGQIDERVALKDATDAAVPLASLKTPTGRSLAATFHELAARLLKETVA